MNWSRTIALCFAFLCAPLVFGQGTNNPQSLTCTTSAIANVLRSGGAQERTGDLAVTCTGGVPGSQQQTLQMVSLTVTMSAATAGRTYSSPWSEALLLIDEPTPAIQSPCAATNSQAACPMTGTGDGVKTYSGIDGRPNVFQGQRRGNDYIWPSIPFDPPGTNRTRVLRFTNLKVDASNIAIGPITATISVQGQFNVQIANPVRTVANVQFPLTLGPPTGLGGSGQLSGFTLAALEGFPTALRTRSTAGTGPADQTDPGLPYPGTETGFHNSAFPVVASRADLGNIGLADSGTRIRVALMNIPSGLVVTAPLTLGNNIAQLINADATSGGPYAPASSGNLANQSGLVVATYEVINATPFQLDTLPFSFAFAAAPGSAVPPLSQVNGVIYFAPLASPNGAPQPSFNPNGGFPFQVNAPAGPSLTITTSTLPGGFVGVTYSQTVQATGGTPPYTFSLAQANTLPPGLTLSTAGAITGTPTTPGKFSFTVQVSDTAQGRASQLFSIEIGNAPPSISVSPRSLDFSAAFNGGPPAIQSLTILSDAPTQFRVRTDAGDGTRPPDWLRVTPISGSTPARLLVSVDPGSLAPGDYSARILITDSSGSLVLDTIPVNLKVLSLPQSLRALPEVVRLQVRAGQAEQRREFVLLRNTGGEGPIPVKLSLKANSSWITSISPTDTTAPPWPPRRIAIDIDTTGLAEGFYRDVLRVEWSGAPVEIPIVLWMAPNAPLLDLSDNGLRFYSRQGERNPIIKRIRVLSRFPNTTVRWSAEVMLGAEWLMLTPTSGQATLDSPSTIRFGLSPDVANLPAGRHYALVRVSDDASAHSPQYIRIVLQIGAPGDPPLLDFGGGGMVLTSSVDGGRTSKDIEIRTPTSSPLPFSLSAAVDDGDADWLSVTPQSGTIDVNTTGAQGTITVTADPSRLAPGVYSGHVTGQAAGQVYVVNVTFIVASADASSASSLKQASLKQEPVKQASAKEASRLAGCVPKKLAFAQTGLVDNFNVPAGWPASLSIELRNDCGAAVGNGTVVASFSTGDPPLRLESEGNNGVYSATWQPSSATAEMNIAIRAAATGLEDALAALVGKVGQNTPPLLFPNGTIHINFHPVEIGGPLAPGMPAEVYGQALANVTSPTDQLPLTKNFMGTRVLIGPYDAPLFFVSPGQVNVQVPWELNTNRRYSILVLTNGEPTQPESIDVVPLKPGITNTRNDSRDLIAQHLDYSLVTPQNPAKRGELLIMYLVGMGKTNPPVGSGAISPGSPPALPEIPLQLSVGGINATVLFAGMTPGGVGLGQINFYVPENAPLNTPLDVVVTQGGIASNVTRLTVAQ